MASTSPSPSPSSPSPSVEDIIAVATECGYSQYRPMQSATLYFVEEQQARSEAASAEDHIQLRRPPVKLHVYFTTHGIMTQLDHPVHGTNQMWRSAAYTTLADLQEFFVAPRKHTGHGYRSADKARRGCTSCGELKTRLHYSLNQWTKKGPGHSRCKDCVGPQNRRPSAHLQLEPRDDTNETNNNKTEDVGVDDITDRLEGIAISTTTGITGTGRRPRLTVDALHQHDQAQTSKQKKTKKSQHKKRQDGMERRQFNCPECPKQGRRPHVFYKQVPKYKPIVKCTICKQLQAQHPRNVAAMNLRRLLAVPRDQERGYGFYHCSADRCGQTRWGSSRAMYNVGQECHDCKELGIAEVMVTPFRMEVRKTYKYNGHNKHKTNQRGNNPMIRVPHEPIQEDAEEATPYTRSDQRRYRESDYESKSYEFRESSSPVIQADVGHNDDDDDRPAPVRPRRQHYCTKCATGECRNRKVPRSKLHEVSDGATVSTRSSLVTNSTIDRTDYLDRDEDFNSFEVDFTTSLTDDDDDDDDNNTDSDSSWLEV